MVVSSVQPSREYDAARTPQHLIPCNWGCYVDNPRLYKTQPLLNEDESSQFDRPAAVYSMFSCWSYTQNLGGLRPPIVLVAPFQWVKSLRFIASHASAGPMLAPFSALNVSIPVSKLLRSIVILLHSPDHTPPGTLI